MGQNIKEVENSEMIKRKLKYVVNSMSIYMYVWKIIKIFTLVNLYSALQDQDCRYSISHLCRKKFLPNTDFF